MSTTLEAIENARGLHERGIKELRTAIYIRNIHPLGALTVVHNVLILPEPDDVESLDAAYDLLTYRLNQPDALTPPTPPLSARALSKFTAGFKSPDEMAAERHIAMWPQALKIIGQPVDPFETWA